VTEFFIRRQLSVLGLPPELADDDRRLREAPADGSAAAPAATGSRGRRHSARR